MHDFKNIWYKFKILLPNITSNHKHDINMTSLMFHVFRAYDMCTKRVGDLECNLILKYSYKVKKYIFFLLFKIYYSIIKACQKRDNKLNYYN